MSKREFDTARIRARDTGKVTGDSWSSAMGSLHGLLDRPDPSRTAAAAAPAPCSICNKPLTLADKAAYNAECGEGWPDCHEDCAELAYLGDEPPVSR
jgi:hypothetical protein